MDAQQMYDYVSIEIIISSTVLVIMSTVLHCHWNNSKSKIIKEYEVEATIEEPQVQDVDEDGTEDSEEPRQRTISVNSETMQSTMFATDGTEEDPEALTAKKTLEAVESLQNTIWVVIGYAFIIVIDIILTGQIGSKKLWIACLILTLQMLQKAIFYIASWRFISTLFHVCHFYYKKCLIEQGRQISARQAAMELETVDKRGQLQSRRLKWTLIVVFVAVYIACEVWTVIYVLGHQKEKIDLEKFIGSVHVYLLMSSGDFVVKSIFFCQLLLCLRYFYRGNKVMKQCKREFEAPCLGPRWLHTIVLVSLLSLLLVSFNVIFIALIWNRKNSLNQDDYKTLTILNMISILGYFCMFSVIIIVTKKLISGLIRDLRQDMQRRKEQQIADDVTEEESQCEARELSRSTANFGDDHFDDEQFVRNIFQSPTDSHASSPQMTLSTQDVRANNRNSINPDQLVVTVSEQDSHAVKCKTQLLNHASTGSQLEFDSRDRFSPRNDEAKPLMLSSSADNQTKNAPLYGLKRQSERFINKALMARVSNGSYSSSKRSNLSSKTSSVGGAPNSTRSMQSAQPVVSVQSSSDDLSESKVQGLKRCKTTR